MKTMNPPKSKKRYFLLLSGAFSLLLIPFVAMQFSSVVNWTASDFIIMGLLLFLTVSTVELTLRILKSQKQRILTASLILFIFLLIWAELAVGVFNSPIAGS